MFQTACFFFYNFKTVIIDNVILALTVLHASQLRYLKLALETITENIEKCSDKDEDRHYYEGCMKIWIQQHQSSLRLIRDFKFLMNKYLLIQYGYIFIHTCVPAFVITSTNSWTAGQKFSMFFIIAWGVIDLFALSWAGAGLIEASQNIQRPFYGEYLFKKSGIFLQNCFIMISQRTRTACSLSVYSTFTLNCISFIHILRLIVSYYMTLNELQRRKDALI